MKSGRTASNDFFKEIVYWNKLSGNRPDRSFVVYGGDQSQQRTAGHLIGYADLDPDLEYVETHVSTKILPFGFSIAVMDNPVFLAGS